MEEYIREPCPWRIVDDSGSAFAIGLLGGGTFQAIKGFRNAPKGFKKRLLNSFTSVTERSPMIAGNFAVWGGTFSMVECTLIHLRQKEDPWNSIISGAVAGGILAVRSGVPAMAGGAVMGGVLLALLEGMGILMNSWQAEQFQPISPAIEDPMSLGKNFN